MPRKHRNRHMKGGFLDNLSNTLSGWGSSLSKGASSMWAKTKNATTSLTNPTASTSLTNPTASTSSYQAPMSTSTYGGKNTSRRRHMRGGYRDNTPTTGLAAHTASFSGKTAQPHNWVGGRTKRRGRKGGFIGEAINQAVVPFSILAMQQKYKKGGRTRRHRRH